MIEGCVDDDAQNEFMQANIMHLCVQLSHCYALEEIKI